VPFFVVVYAMAVCAQDYALLYFFHGGFETPIANKLVYAVCFVAGVYVVEIQRCCMVEPALSAVKRGLVRLPFFSKR